MREGWTETSIGEIAEVIGGGTPSTSKSEYWGGEIVWLTPTEVVPRDGQLLLDSERRITDEGLRNSGAHLLPTGSVILTSRASVGFVGISGVELCTNQGFQSLVPGDTALAKFLMYWIQSNRAEFESRAAGSTFKEISKSNVKSIQLLLPSLPEQKRIVDLISSVDSYIAALQQQVDAVRVARAAVLSELLSAGGEDWTENTLGPLVTLRTGKLDVNAGVEDGEFPFFTCSRDTYKIDVAAYEGKSVIVAGNGDLNVKYYEGKFNAYQRTYILQSVDETVLSPIFLFCFMEKYVETLRNNSQGSTIQYLKKAQFIDAPIHLPSLVEQTMIVAVVSSIDEVIQSADKAVADAKKLRSGLLSELLSGSHEIPESYDRLLGAA